MDSKRVLIFDFDGTIVDSGDFVIKILNDMAPDFGLKKLSESEIEHLRNFSARQLVRQLKVPVYKLPFVVRRFRKEFAEAVKYLEPIEGIPEVVKKLHDKGHTMHIVSSNTEENIRFFLEKYEINYFEKVVGSNSLFGKYIKINRVVRDGKLPKENVVYVGDEIRDVEAGRKAGVKVAAVTWGLNTKQALENENPDWVLSKPQELLQL